MKKITFSLLALIAFLLLNFELKSQDFQPDFNKFVSDINISDSNGEKTRIMFWLPNIYWQLVLQNSTSQQEIDDIIEIFEDYTVFMILDGKQEALSYNYSDYDEIFEQISIVDYNNDVFYPISQDELTDDIKIYMSILPTIMGSTMGKMGENMQLFAFPAKNKDGVLIADEYSENSFTFIFGNDSYRFKLPVSSLYPEKVCPT